VKNTHSHYTNQRAEKVLSEQENSVAKCVAKAKDRNERTLALVDNGNGTWKVLVLCANYDGNCRGGMRHTWRVLNKRGETNTQYSQRTEADARALFTQRSR
jgi:hypothetical protein